MAITLQQLSQPNDDIEASQAGFAPGEWPERLTVTDFRTSPRAATYFVHAPYTNREGEVVYMTYQKDLHNEDRHFPAHITVWND